MFFTPIFLAIISTLTFVTAYEPAGQAEHDTIDPGLLRPSPAYHAKQAAENFFLAKEYEKLASAEPGNARIHMQKAAHHEEHRKQHMTLLNQAAEESVRVKPRTVRVKAQTPKAYLGAAAQHKRVAKQQTKKSADHAEAAAKSESIIAEHVGHHGKDYKLNLRLANYHKTILAGRLLQSAESKAMAAKLSEFKDEYRSIAQSLGGNPNPNISSGDEGSSASREE